MTADSLSFGRGPADSRSLLFRFAWPGMSFRIPLEPDLLLSSRLEILLRSFEESSLVESADMRRPWALLVSLPPSGIEVRLLFDSTFLMARDGFSDDLAEPWDTASVAMYPEADWYEKQALLIYGVNRAKSKFKAVSITVNN